MGCMDGALSHTCAALPALPRAALPCLAPMRCTAWLALADGIPYLSTIMGELGPPRLTAKNVMDSEARGWGARLVGVQWLRLTPLGLGPDCRRDHG